MPKHLNWDLDLYTIYNLQLFKLDKLNSKKFENLISELEIVPIALLL